MIMTFDTETRGLFGNIFLVGCYDGKEYKTFFSGKEFIEYLKTLEVTEKKEEISVYCFNLDFDLAKLVRENVDFYKKTGKPLFEIDYSKSLIIHNRFHAAKILGIPVVFRDLYPLVNSSLEKSCIDFGLKTQKMELNIADEDKENYFKTVSPYDEKFQNYLYQDVIATWELLHVLVELSGLELEAFIKCPTLASLSMKIFKTTCPEEMELIKKSELYKEQEDFVRKAYHGGRTEIFRHCLIDGYHYDVNSLYPYVMESNKFPIDDAKMWLPTVAPERKLPLFNKIREGSFFPVNYILHAKVHVPNQHVGPLPYRDEKGLIFPVGTFIGYFCSPELEYAIKECDVEVLEVYDILYFEKEANLFSKFIKKQKEIKLNSTGAKRAFSKNIQVNLYGKFGMMRLRENIEKYTPERAKKLEDKGKKIAVYNTYNDDQLMCHLKFVFADYIRPQYAAFITSYARVELLKKLRAIPPENLYYCDTDSIVSSIPFPEEEVDAKLYGKWKLEREVEKGIFILPKLYAEIDKNSKEEILKSKGLVKEYRSTISYNDYIIYYDSMVKNKNYQLYGYDLEKPYYRRQKLITAIKNKRCPDTKILLRKSFLFESIRQKRIYDFSKNTSIPIDITVNI